MKNKIDAFLTAQTLIDPIIKEHGIKEVRKSVNMFTTVSVETPVEQHISHILNIAEWLLNDGK
jgi:hypothetical protein